MPAPLNKPANEPTHKAAHSPLRSLCDHPQLQAPIDAVLTKTAATQRRPIILRRSAEISTEALIRSALTAHRLYPTTATQQTCLSAYSLLTPSHILSTTTTFSRAPLQILLSADTLLGGTGTPHVDATERIHALSSLITHCHNSPADHAPVLAAIAHAEITNSNAFGPRSPLIGLLASRLVATTFGLDPHALFVPELYWVRHRDELHQQIKDFNTNPRGVITWVESSLQSWTVGAEEASGIIQQL